MYQSPLTAFDPESSTQVFRLRSRGSLHRLTHRARRLARLCDGRRTLAQVCQEGKVSMTHACAVVEELTRLGALVEVDRGPAEGGDRASEPAGFTTLEEEFFASEVLPDEEDFEPEPPGRVGLILARLKDRIAHRPPMAAELDSAGVP